VFFFFFFFIGNVFYFAKIFSQYGQGGQESV